MKKYNLEFCFKGARTYIQGPDIFDAVLDVIKKDFNVSKITNIKYSTHSMLHANADLMIKKN